MTEQCLLDLGFVLTCDGYVLHLEKWDLIAIADWDESCIIYVRRWDNCNELFSSCSDVKKLKELIKVLK